MGIGKGKADFSVFPFFYRDIIVNVNPDEKRIERVIAAVFARNIEREIEFRGNFYIDFFHKYSVPIVFSVIIFAVAFYGTPLFFLCPSTGIEGRDLFPAGSADTRPAVWKAPINPRCRARSTR